MIEDLIAVADADYRLAREGIPRLPSEFGRSVAAASAIYAGIHDGIRQNGYDNLTRRARTSPARKVWLATKAIWDLSASKRGSPKLFFPRYAAGPLPPG
jgi:phytoene synthase